MPFLDPPDLPDFIARQLAFEGRTLERGLYRLESGGFAGETMHYLDLAPARVPGDGTHDDAERKAQSRTVVLLHGNPTWSFLWRKVMARLPEYRCLAPDLVGLGLSSKPRSVDDHRLTRHGDAVAEWVRAQDLEDFILVGQDWGGPCATGLGFREPDRVAGVVLGNTGVIAPKSWGGKGFHKFSRMPVLSTLVFRVLGFPLRSLHKAQGNPETIQDEVARAYRWPLRRYRDRAAPLAMARMVPDGPDHPSVEPLGQGEEWLRGFAGPVALVWGEKDPILGRVLHRHAEALPTAEITRTDAGHFLQEEVPESLASAIRRTDERAAAGQP